jgi:hypothetical protein
MKTKKNNGYTEAPLAVERALAKAVRVRDFLPSPEELIGTDNKMTKITLYVNSKSLDVFRNYARRKHGKYQLMIRKLMDAYADRISAS